MNIGLSMLFCLSEPLSSVIGFKVDCMVLRESLHVLNQKPIYTLKKVDH
jgi:hypothetical protein